MNEEQRAAFLNSQATCAFIKALGMQAENTQRQMRGESPAYSSGDFFVLETKYRIGHNDAISLLRQS